MPSLPAITIVPASGLISALTGVALPMEFNAAVTDAGAEIIDQDAGVLAATT